MKGLSLVIGRALKCGLRFAVKFFSPGPLLRPSTLLRLNLLFCHCATHRVIRLIVRADLVFSWERVRIFRISNTFKFENVNFNVII
jgi:hypothetical protein